MATTLSNISIKDDSEWNTLLDLVYPVGSFYLSSQSTSPAEIMGGSWTQVISKYLRADNVFTTGGRDNITINQMPSHSHNVGTGTNPYAFITSDNNSVGSEVGSEWGGGGYKYPRVPESATISRRSFTQNTGGGQRFIQLIKLCIVGTERLNFWKRGDC